MRKIIEMKNEKTGLNWTEVEPRPQRYDDYVSRKLAQLRADEKVNNHGFVYRIRKINA